MEAKLLTKAYRLGAGDAEGGGEELGGLAVDFGATSLRSLGWGFGAVDARSRSEVVKNRDWAEEETCGRAVRGVKVAQGQWTRRKPLAKLAMPESQQWAVLRRRLGKKEAAFLRMNRVPVS